MEATAISNTYIAYYMSNTVLSIVLCIRSTLRGRCCYNVHFTKKEKRGKEKRGELPKVILLKKNQCNFYDWTSDESQAVNIKCKAGLSVLTISHYIRNSNTANGRK